MSFTWDIAPAACVAGETFAVDQLGTMTDCSGNTAYCYERRGNLVKKVQTTGGVALQFLYGYTLADCLAWGVYPDGTLVDYNRNGNRDISAVDAARPDSAQPSPAAGSGLVSLLSPVRPGVDVQIFRQGA